MIARKQLTSQSRWDSVFTNIITVGLLIILVAVPLVFSAKFYSSFSLPKRAFFQISVSLILVVFALQLVRNPSRLTAGSTRLDLILLAWLVWDCASSILSIDRPESMRELIYSASLVGFYFLITRNVISRSQALLFIGTIALAGVVEASYGIAQRFGAKLLYESEVRQTATIASMPWRWSILGTFGNANHLASYLVLTCPILFGYAALWREFPRYLVLFCIVVTILCLILIGARGSWLAACAGMVIALAVGFRAKRRSTMRFALYGISIIVIALVIANFFNPDIAGNLTRRVRESFSTGAQSSVGYRLLTWNLSLRMIASHPIFGSGPGTFKLMFMPTFAEYLRDRDPLSFWWLTEKMNEPHNEFLQTAVETGIPGLFFLIVMCVLVLRPAFEGLKRFSSAQDLWLVGLAASFSAVLVDAFASIPFHVVPTRVAFWAIAAILCARLSPPEHPPAAAAGWESRLPAWRWGFLAYTLIFLWIALSASIHNLSAEYYFKIGSNLNFASRHAHALLFFKKALDCDPSSGQIRFYYGSTLVRMGRYAEGAAELEKSKRNFQDVFLYKNLGTAYAKMGKMDLALKQYQRWRGMGIASHEANNRIALVRLAQGRSDEAERLFRETLRARPLDWLAHSSLGVMLIDSGRYEEAAQVLEPAGFEQMPEAHALHGIALMKAGRYEDAENSLLRALSGDPRSIKARIAIAGVYSFTNRRDEAIAGWEEVLRLDPENEIAKKNLKAVRKGMKIEL